MSATSVALDIQRHLELANPRGEIRARYRKESGKEGIRSLYYTKLEDPANMENAVTEAKELSDKPNTIAVYLLMQDLGEALPDDSDRANKSAEVVWRTVKAKNIARITRLVVDVDSNKPEEHKHAPATDTEHEAALAIGHECAELTDSLGWPQPLFVDTGNGAQLTYALPSLPRCPEVRAGMQQLLNAFAAKLNGPGGHVDLSLCDPARVCRLAGTMNRKGVSTPERPHRMARIISAPEAFEPVPSELLSEFAATAPKVEPKAYRTNGAVESADLDDLQVWITDYCADHGHAVEPRRDYDKVALDFDPNLCPIKNRPAATPGRASVLLYDDGDGRIGFHCYHEQCNCRRGDDLTGWEALQEAFGESFCDWLNRKLLEEIRVEQEWLKQRVQKPFDELAASFGATCENGVYRFAKAATVTALVDQWVAQDHALSVVRLSNPPAPLFPTECNDEPAEVWINAEGMIVVTLGDVEYASDIPVVNTLISFAELCEAHGGVDNTDSGRYVFGSLTSLPFRGLPELPDGNTATLSRTERGILVEHCARKRADRLDSFTYDGNKHTGTLLIELPAHRYADGKRKPPATVSELDRLLRIVVAPNEEDIEGRFYRTARGNYVRGNQADLLDILAAKGVEPEDRSPVLGTAKEKVWTTDLTPFRPTWNTEQRTYNKGARLSCEPRQGEFPMADWMLQHIGSYLTPFCEQHPWCIKHGIDGPEWMRLWPAIMIQKPEQSTPALYLYSDDQDTCGKSTFLRYMKRFFQKGSGVADIKTSLGERFNQNLLGALLGFIDEVGSLEPSEWETLKEFIEADDLNIRGMRENAKLVPCLLHIILTTNKLDSLPVQGDVQESRVVFIEVPEIPLERRNDFIKRNGAEQLRKELPHVLWALKNKTLPPPDGRLYLPRIDTALRRRVLGITMDIETFLAAHYDRDPEGYVPAAEFVEDWKMKTGMSLTQRVLQEWLTPLDGVSLTQDRSKSSKRIVKGIKPKQ